MDRRLYSQDFLFRRFNADIRRGPQLLSSANTIQFITSFVSRWYYLKVILWLALLKNHTSSYANLIVFNFLNLFAFCIEVLFSFKGILTTEHFASHEETKQESERANNNFVAQQSIKGQGLLSDCGFTSTCP